MYTNNLHETKNSFVERLIKNETPVRIFISNGYQFKGVIVDHDSDVYFVKPEVGDVEMVFESAISTIAPYIASTKAAKK